MCRNTRIRICDALAEFMTNWLWGSIKQSQHQDGRAMNHLLKFIRLENNSICIWSGNLWVFHGVSQVFLWVPITTNSQECERIDYIAVTQHTDLSQIKPQSFKFSNLVRDVLTNTYSPFWPQMLWQIKHLVPISWTVKCYRMKYESFMNFRNHLQSVHKKDNFLNLWDLWPQWEEGMNQQIGQKEEIFLWWSPWLVLQPMQLI